MIGLLQLFAFCVAGESPIAADAPLAQANLAQLDETLGPGAEKKEANGVAAAPASGVEARPVVQVPMPKTVSSAQSKEEGQATGDEFPFTTVSWLQTSAEAGQGAGVAAAHRAQLFAKLDRFSRHLENVELAMNSIDGLSDDHHLEQKVEYMSQLLDSVQSVETVFEQLKKEMPSVVSDARTDDLPSKPVSFVEVGAGAEIGSTMEMEALATAGAQMQARLQAGVDHASKNLIAIQEARDAILSLHTDEQKLSAENATELIKQLSEATLYLQKGLDQLKEEKARHEKKRAQVRPTIVDLVDLGGRPSALEGHALASGEPKP